MGGNGGHAIRGGPFGKHGLIFFIIVRVDKHDKTKLTEIIRHSN